MSDKPQDIHVDLLAIDMETGRYWLDPLEKGSDKLAEIRRRNRDKWLADQKAKRSLKRLGLTDERINKLLRLAPAKSAKTREKDYDEDKHPRDEHGRWTDGGDSGVSGSQESEPVGASAEANMMLVSHTPTQEKLDKWHQQIDTRLQKLEETKKAGNREYENLVQMKLALEAYKIDARQSGLKEGNASLMTVYDGTEANKLKAASFSVSNTDGNVSIEYFGSLNKASGAKTIDFVVDTFPNAHSIEVNLWADDKAKIKLFSDAGFKQTKGGTEHGFVTMSKGEVPSSADAPSFADAPLPVVMGENTSVRFQNNIANTLNAMQKSCPAALAHIKNMGVKVRCADFITSANPELRGVQPRGWPTGSTWDQAEGLFDSGKAEIVTAESIKKSDGSTYRSERIPGVLSHETGHGFDYSLGSPSINSKRFKDAYDEDVKNIAPDKRENIEYYLQGGSPAGRQEAFAETFANHLGQHTSWVANITPFFPRTAVLIKEAMDSGKWEGGPLA
jgi:hypothetical protein